MPRVEEYKPTFFTENSRRLRMVPRVLSHRLRAWPDFLVIGAQKAGTTSRYAYLLEHPCGEPATKKEVQYYSVRYSRGPAWYRAHFPTSLTMARTARRHGRAITGEASPYYLFHPLVPERARADVPAARLIALLRDPVERAYSHYQHLVRLGTEPLSFEEAVAREPERLAGQAARIRREPGYYAHEFRNFSYLARGVYVDQIAAWRASFPAAQLMVLRSEDFWADPAATYRDVTRFLGLPDWAPESFREYNVGQYAGLSEDTRGRLRETFRPHNERLRALLGERFTWGW